MRSGKKGFTGTPVDAVVGCRRRRPSPSLVPHVSLSRGAGEGVDFDGAAKRIELRPQGAPPPAHDWFRYLITRYDPQSVPQTSVVGMLNDLFGPYVLPKAMLQTPAVSTSGLLGQTIYETSLGRDRSDEVSRATYRRALDAFDDVNREIELLIRRTWRRA